MKLKNLSQILSRLIDLTLITGGYSLNDFSTGSVIGSIYEAIAMELEQYYILGRENILWGIEEGVYEAFDFPRRPARRAYGDITLEFNTTLQRPAYIARGTRFSSNIQGYPQRFETLEDFVVPAGRSKAVVTAYCTETGESGNVPKNTINVANSSIMNLRSVRNEQDFLTGTEQESLEKVKRRFRSFVSTRGRATNKALDYGARTVEDITGVYIREETGYIRVYAHDKNGNLPEDLKYEVESALENYRPSGIRLDVLPVERKAVDLDVGIVLRDNARNNQVFHDQVTLEIRNYLNRMEASEDLIRTDLIQTIMGIDDYAIYDTTIHNLSENLAIEPHQIIRAGTVSVAFHVL